MKMVATGAFLFLVNFMPSTVKQTAQNIGHPATESTRQKLCSGNCNSTRQNLSWEAHGRLF
jgi:hypothetical protein